MQNECPDSSAREAKKQQQTERVPFNYAMGLSVTLRAPQKLLGDGHYLLAEQYLNWKIHVCVREFCTFDCGRSTYITPNIHPSPYDCVSV